MLKWVKLHIVHLFLPVCCQVVTSDLCTLHTLQHDQYSIVTTVTQYTSIHWSFNIYISHSYSNYYYFLTRMKSCIYINLCIIQHPHWTPVLHQVTSCCCIIHLFSYRFVYLTIRKIIRRLKPLMNIKAEDLFPFCLVRKVKSGQTS